LKVPNQLDDLRKKISRVPIDAMQDELDNPLAVFSEEPSTFIDGGMGASDAWEEISGSVYGAERVV